MKNILLSLTLALCLIIMLVSCIPKPSSKPDNPPVTPGVHECESVCDTCEKCTDPDCMENVCAEKCSGHVNLPEIDVGDLQ